jgi:hypothetical protein
VSEEGNSSTGIYSQNKRTLSSLKISTLLFLSSFSFNFFASSIHLSKATLLPLRAEGITKRTSQLFSFA